ncbi:uncharacterized protein Trissin isoform X2 [Maniola hyperantus]|uniref:uncharacterized protein Trissin isoform X2 n=1 Tax=Aphantopus hyperantus TaxID=2795564 RepID=UPI00156844E0|nr:uncharacterized protein LOC117994204 isoform X1 [Maniola hyperantus]
MLKITAIVSLMLIATWSQADPSRHKREGAPSVDFDSGSTMWAASLSCDSCGSECAAACGTRHFRSCCFNYLRRKRGPDSMKLSQMQNLHEFKSEGQQKSKLPVFGVEDIPDFWGNMMASDYRFNPFDDTLENRLQAMYDA